VIAFARGWLLACVLLSCIPLIILVGGIMSLMMSRMSTRGQVVYAEAGGLAEQILGSIRTVRN